MMLYRGEATHERSDVFALIVTLKKPQAQAASYNHTD